MVHRACCERKRLCWPMEEGGPVKSAGAGSWGVRDIGSEEEGTRRSGLPLPPSSVHHPIRISGHPAQAPDLSIGPCSGSINDLFNRKLRASLQWSSVCPSCLRAASSVSPPHWFTR
ncbi:hypothetical protein A0H81_00917 [Grifola frondosa]|uniref:Uncharacterized protein n=1 Tax=Grifola frondosa TaxID=5627 RepID=A0A1C7MTY9_GRIFR|nr:hypothetical protein A0H81_00917 [Grifola frondosa]